MTKTTNENNEPKPNETTSSYRPYITVLRAEKHWIEKARKDSIFFQHYLLDKKPALHHRLWHGLILLSGLKRINLIAPRESAKTTTLMAIMAWYIGHNPHTTNSIISVSASQAESRLRVLKGYINDHPRFKNVFPYIEIDYKEPVTQQRFTVLDKRMGYGQWKRFRGTHSDIKDSTLFCAGRGGAGIIGSRYSGLNLLDDIIDENDLTALSQEKAIQWLYQTFEPCVKKETGIIAAIGTRWMVDDVPEQLSKNPEWHTASIKALYTNPDTGEERSYWPEYWPVEELHKKRRAMNNDALFEIMYQSNPLAMTANAFTIDGLSRKLPFPLPRFTSVYIGVDLAVSLKERADYNVFSAIGLDSANNLYLLEQQRMKLTPDLVVEQLATFADHVAKMYGRLDLIVSENVAYQASFMHNVNAKRYDLPITGYTPKGDKSHRAQIVARIANDGKFFVNTEDENYPVFKGECMNFPLAKHDDTLDSVSLVVQFLGMSATSSSEVEFIKSEYFL